MNCKFFLPLTALFFAFTVLPATAQKFQPKTIQFKGDPEYSDQELLAAAGLKNGMLLDFADMKAYAQKLTDSGVFATVGFQFSGAGLVFALTPADQLYPIRLENLPFTQGKELDAELHGRLPLFHGKVPAGIGLADQVRQALQAMLAAKGIDATVTVFPYTDEKLQQVTAMSYAITTPPVVVGAIHLDVASAPDAASGALDPVAVQMLSKLTGAAYDTQGSPNQIETALGNYYSDKGYVAAEVHAVPLGSPVVAADGIHIPFQVSVAPGRLYQLSGIRLASGLLVSQADFDRQSQIHPSVTATGKYVRANLDFITRQYHDHGYMKAQVHATPSFDQAQGTVSYNVTVDPGPVYMMGRLTIENVSDDLQARMIAAWTLPAGAVFNERAISDFYAIRDADPTLERVFSSVNCTYTLTLIPTIHRVNVTLRLEKRN